MSKSQIDKEHLKATERLKTLANALKHAILDEDSSVLEIQRSTNLSADFVKHTLDEILSTSTSACRLAHVILDESGGHLFDRDDLVNEERAALACVRKMHNTILQNANADDCGGGGGSGGLKQPILVITNDSKRSLHTRIVAFLPDEFANKVRVYFFDPLTGDRDIFEQTENGMFVRYLQEGCVQNGVNPLLGVLQRGGKYENRERICSNEENSGWWCLFYALLLIHERNDSFLEKFDNLITNDCNGGIEKLGRLKNVLATHIDFLSQIDCTNMTQQSFANNSQQCGQNYESAVKKLAQFDAELRAANDELEKNIEECIKNLEQGSDAKRMAELEKQQSELGQSIRQLEEEISRLEANIQEGQSLISNSSNSSCTATKLGDTVEDKYKRFITGEEKQLIEARLVKSEKARRHQILAHSDDCRRCEIEEECRLLEEKATGNECMLREKELELKTRLTETTDLENQNNEQNKKLEELKSKCEQLVSQLKQLNENIKNSEAKTSQIDSIPSSSQCTNLINVLLSHVTSVANNKKTDLENLKSRIETCDKQIESLEKELVTVESECQTQTRLRDELRIKRDVASSSTNKYSKQSTQYASELTTAKEKYAEYDSWWWKLWYPGTVKELQGDINRIESAKKSVDSSWTNAFNEFKEYEKKIEQCEQTLGNLESSKTTKKNSLSSEKKSKESMISNELKSVRDAMLESFSSQMKSDRKALQEKEIAKNGVESEIKSTENTIERIRKELDNKKSLIRNCNVIIDSYNHTLKSLQDKINKLRQSLKNISNSASTVKETETEAEEKTEAENSTKSSHSSWPKKTLLNSTIVRDETTERELLSLLHFEAQKWRLLYRASDNGFAANDFHRSCDGKCNTLTLVKSSKNDRRIFGGYTGAKWSSHAGFVTDPHAFVFSLMAYNKRDGDEEARWRRRGGFVARCVEPERAIYCKSTLGPSFGDNDIKIADLSDKNDLSCAALNVYQIDRDDDYQDDNDENDDTDSDYLILAGSEHFETSEIEVYCKDYNELTDEELNRVSANRNESIETIREAYEAFHAIAINGLICQEKFVDYLIYKVNVFKNAIELEEMKGLFIFIFEHFDKDKSGELDFDEFLRCYLIFNKKKKKEIMNLYFGFFFDLADTDNNGVLDGEEIKTLFSQFPGRFAGFKMMALLKKYAKKGTLKKTEFASIFEKDIYVDESDKESND